MPKKKAKTKGTTAYTPDSLYPILKNRKTTMPPLSGAPDPNRPPGGPPADPFEKVLAQLLTYDRAPLSLIGLITAQQATEDRNQWFKTAAEYVERTAIMQKVAGKILGHIPFTGDDLLARLRRSKAQQRLLDEAMAVIRLVAMTMWVERADLMRMTDVVNTEMDLQIKRPTLDEKTRADLMQLFSFPNRIWLKRVAEGLQTRDANQQSRDTIDELEQELADQLAGTPSGVTVTLPSGPSQGPLPPAGTKGQTGTTSKSRGTTTTKAKGTGVSTVPSTRRRTTKSG